MENITGLVVTAVLAAGIGFLTLRGFRREVSSIKNGSCCGSDSCGCGGSCSSQCSHDETRQDRTKTQES
ncbi:hypothetical protein [Desulforamulus ruminis]|uniref:Uncharacterized protein n=1 Tax=Desulforamulus ruminis (strain ATCC 23193 / DSM 2154 / NCIMB 8452 / DL) TaxID=696281 RepID=F6DJT9_DESRL|nr:hypothetical protein [Desulforamulus ruminis]AEG59153.1 hypothetical protein Desru_0876 [Desulforamulus ruminis DSM 2154]